MSDNGIEYAEISWDSGDGGDYLNIYANEKTHSYLLEDILERMSEPVDAALRAEVERLQRVEQAYIRAAMFAKQLLESDDEEQEFWGGKLFKILDAAALKGDA